MVQVLEEELVSNYWMLKIQLTRRVITSIACMAPVMAMHPRPAHPRLARLQLGLLELGRTPTSCPRLGDRQAQRPPLRRSTRRSLGRRRRHLPLLLVLPPD